MLQGMDDQIGGCMVAKSFDPGFKVRGDARDRSRDCLRRQIRVAIPKLGRDIASLYGEDGSVGGKGVEAAGSVENLPCVGVEVAQVYSQVDAMHERGGAQHRNDRFESKGTEYCDTMRREVLRAAQFFIA